MSQRLFFFFFPDTEQLTEVSVCLSQNYFEDRDLCVHSHATVDIIKQSLSHYFWNTMFVMSGKLILISRISNLSTSVGLEPPKAVSEPNER